MKRPPRLQASDVRGTVRLAVEATAGVTDLVEAMHERIARLPGFSAQGKPGRTAGITGLVYKTVRGVTRFTGSTLDALLGLLAPALPASAPDGEPDREREAVVAALNGVLGDHLAATGNPLATTMSLRSEGRLVHAMADERPVLLMIHGLCMNDLQWRRDGHDHGQALAQALGFAPLYLRYNSGLPIATNGRELALRLEELLAAAPPRRRLVMLCHSMGGLVARSALHQAGLLQLRWPALLSDLLFLGTPHHGAPLERAGHWIDLLLDAAPYAAPLARLGKIRSAGITDLRHGGLPQVQLPSAVRCFALAACLGEPGAALKGRPLGDGLVPLDSALGRHANPAQALHFAAERQWIGYAMNHMQLLSREEAYAQLLRWLS